VEGEEKQSHLKTNQMKRYKVEEVKNTLKRSTAKKRNKENNELSSMKPPLVLPTMPAKEVSRGGFS
jgi:hypothetical protein